MRKINLILNSAERSAYVCVWRILNQDAVNLKRRTDPIKHEKLKATLRKSYDKHKVKRREEQRIKNKTNMMTKHTEFQKKKEIKIETESNILLKIGEFN